MYSNNQRSPTLVNVCDFNTLYSHERNANLNTKNYLSLKSVISPLSRRHLRLVVTNGIPSNILILPRTLSSSPQQSTSKQEKKESKKSPKSTGFDVYRSLPRPASRYSPNSDQDVIYEDITSLGNSIIVDRISPLSNTGLFRTSNLPKISKQQINSNENLKSIPTLETMSKHVEYLRSTPNNQYYEDEKNKMTNILSCMSKDQTRKQLHVYMPEINC